MGDVSSLVSLWVQGNRLDTLPASLEALENLKAIWASGNGITRLPPELSYVKLQTLWLDANPLPWSSVLARLARAGTVVVHDSAPPRSDADPPIVAIAHTALSNFGHSLLDVAVPLATLRRCLDLKVVVLPQKLTFITALTHLVGMDVRGEDPPEGSSSVPLPPRSSAGPFLAAEVAALRATATAADAPPRDSGGPRVTFVRRRSGVRRRLSNEDDLLEALAAACDARGATWRVVALEGTAMRDQVRIFAESDVIIGQHGAAFANALWMREDATLVEIGAFWDLHRNLCDALNVSYVALEQGQAGYTARICVDLDAARSALDVALGRSSRSR